MTFFPFLLFPSLFPSLLYLRTHRKSNNAPATGSELRESLYEPFVSKKDAYKNEHLICNMYGFLKNTLRLYDYDTFNHVDCEQKKT